MKKILPFFSYAFHPIFIPMMAALFYFLFNISNFKTDEIYFVLFQIGIVTILIPITLFNLLRATGHIDSIMLPNLSQRKIPLVLQCFLIILLVRRSITLQFYPELHFFLLGALFSTIFALLFLFFKTKASLHMLGISALTVFVFGLNFHHQSNTLYIIPFLILMNGFVASSRLEMKAHTPKELILGFAVGSIPQLLLLYLWL